MPELVCENCGAAVPVPVHCGKPMKPQKVDGKEMLVCWMGANCGKSYIQRHCGKEMKYKP